MKIKYTPSFKRQLKNLLKKHYPVKLLKPCLKAIIEQDRTVLTKIKDHALKGKWSGYREFHPARYQKETKNYDRWIVIYHLDNRQLVLVLLATGTHNILNKIY